MLLPVTIIAAMFSALIAGCPSDPVDTLFRLYAGKHPGATLAVVKDGAIIYERAYGLANVEANERAAPETNYRIASITKQFTAMAILQLAEKGALSIDDPVVRHVPELAAAKGVTLRHLLTHTSGLPEYEPLLAKDGTDQVFDRDVVALIAQHKLDFAPGTAYRYSNSGYAVLAIVVERVSKLAFGEYLKRHIFQPLGMTGTLAYDPAAAIAHRAYGYSAGARADQTRTTAVLGDGGIYSSVRDLARWVAALEHNTLLDPKRLAEATRAHVATDAPGVSYGFGWRIAEWRGDKLVFHTGTTSGFKHVLLWVPSRKLSVIVLTNRRQGDPFTLGSLVLDRFWNR